MTRDEIIAFMNKNPACHLATVEGDKPHVRGVLIYRADEDGILFHTGNMKDLYKQLSKNPNVELCFNNFQDNIQIRVSGRAELMEDMGLKKEIVANRDFLKPWVAEMGYEILVIFRVKGCVAVVWTFERNFAPKEYIGLGKKAHKG